MRLKVAWRPWAAAVSTKGVPGSGKNSAQITKYYNPLPTEKWAPGQAGLPQLQLVRTWVALAARLACHKHQVRPLSIWGPSRESDMQENISRIQKEDRKKIKVHKDVIKCLWNLTLYHHYF
jgi:hypothetical protein